MVLFLAARSCLAGGRAINRDAGSPASAAALAPQLQTRGTGGNLSLVVQLWQITIFRTPRALNCRAQTCAAALTKRDSLFADFDQRERTRDHRTTAAAAGRRGCVAGRRRRRRP